MKKKILAVVLSCAMIIGMMVPRLSVYAETTPAMTELPGTTKVEKDYDETFMSVVGFGADGVQDRSHYYNEYVANGMKDTANYRVVDADCYMDEDFNRLSKSEYDLLEPTEQSNYKWVTSEEQFCKAISEARVVEIRQDLELGYKYLEDNNIPTYGVIEKDGCYDKGYPPISSPILMEVGISDIYVSSHMTIFSPSGNKIEHACFELNGVEDIVLRNLAIEGNYEWDDVPEGANSTPGNSTRYGWSNVSCNNAEGVWLDHCDFGYSFDGNIDLKNDSQVSITWCRFGVQDISKNSDLYKNIEYMEEKYQAGEGFQIYKVLRDNGATQEQIFNLACEHHSVHLVGSGKDDYETNPLNAITMAYTQYIDCDNRMPKIRQGNGHMFNCYFDSQTYLENCYADATFLAARDAAKDAGYSVKGICRGLDPSLGASIGADTCVWDGFLDPVLGAEDNEEGADGRFAEAVNYQLVVNSSIRRWDSKKVYTGSSWDNGGDNPFASGLFKKALTDSYIDRKFFQWSEWKPMTKVQSEAIDGVYYVPEGIVDNMKSGEFYKTYYLGREQLGYDYQTVPLEDVKVVTDAYSGAGKVTMETAGDWTKLYYGLEDGEHTVTFEEDNGVMDGYKTIVYGENEKLGDVPVPKKEGYAFNGWYEMILVDGVWIYKETPVTKDTVVTEDMVLRAKWEINKYTVTYDSLGGSQVEPLTGVEHGSSYRTMNMTEPKPTRDGFTFQGWYDAFDRNNAEKPFGGKLLKGTAFTENCTYYAKWKATKVDLIFNSNGGSEVQSMTDLNINATTGLPEAPTKDGYQFAGWYYDEALTKEFVADSTKLTASLSYLIDIDGELNLYAKWEEAPDIGLKGDVNGDSVADALDALEILKSVAGMLPEPFSPEQLALADVEDDGVADALDALKILKVVAGMIPGFDE